MAGKKKKFTVGWMHCKIIKNEKQHKKDKIISRYIFLRKFEKDFNAYIYSYRAIYIY